MNLDTAPQISLAKNAIPFLGELETQIIKNVLAGFGGLR
jgi:hypothetical protein